MRALYEMDIIQIDVTNACMNQCANCTRFCGHHRKPFFMEKKAFRKAVDSLVGFPGMVGMIGGEPLLHPDFPWMANYLALRIEKRAQRGLWSTLPRWKMCHADTIKKVFGNLYLNDHSVGNVLHQPVLVAAQEMIGDRVRMWRYIENCWVQTMWSASITPKGAFFCEVAASLDMLFDGPGGWPVEAGWWERAPDAFIEQKEQWCPICGCAIPLKRRRSVDRVDDVSLTNLARLNKMGSPKINGGLFHIYTEGVAQKWQPDPNWYMSEVEEEGTYRSRIAARLDG